MAEPAKRPFKRRRYTLEIIETDAWLKPERVWASFADGTTFPSSWKAELYMYEHCPVGHKMHIREETIERHTTQLDAESTRCLVLGGNVSGRGE